MLAARTHPPGLYVLFFTEMWERFSYYGMRALLVLYLVEALDYARADALRLYATYTALVYLTPILGGWLADRWLGQRRAVLIGALVMALGHFAMGVPELLSLALGLLIAGNGFFKPNISTLVGGLYAPADPRRDAGFTLFYMGINLGAFFSPLVAGTLGATLGWHWGFGAAGIGMLCGLAVFVFGQPVLGGAGPPPRVPSKAPAQSGARDGRVVLGWTVAVTLVVAGVVYLGPRVLAVWRDLPVPAQLALPLIGAGLLLTGRRQRTPPPLSREEWQRLLALAIIAGFVIVFWMGFEQAGGTLNLFALHETDRVVFGREVPATWFQALNPLFILALAPLMSALWVRLDASRLALGPAAKQAWGMIILGLGFVVLAVAAERSVAHGPVSPLWLLGTYFLFTVGELFLSPIGLSMVTRLAPQRLAALLMGLWFTAIAIANYLAGTLEALLEGTGIPLYVFLMTSSIGAGLLLLALSPLLHRLMHGAR